jgi:hypothetical protein
MGYSLISSRQTVKPQSNPEDVVPLAEYLEPCIRWAQVWFAMAAAARADNWSLAERFVDAGEGVLAALEAQA